MNHKDDAKRYMSPADEGIAAARRDAGLDPEKEIKHELQTWNTDLLVTMEQYTHGAGRDMIRAELAARGVDRMGRWVGFPEARKCWCMTDTEAAK